MNKPSVNIEGKTILFTGALGLIGTEITQSFLEQGARVVLGDIAADRLVQRRESLAKEFDRRDFLVLSLDITSEENCHRAVEEAVRTFGSVDVLVNNAAIDAKFEKGASGSFSGKFEEFPMDMLRTSVEVNLLGTVRMTQLACRQMLAQGHGNIINVASTYSLVAPNQTLYDMGDGVESFKPIDYVATKSFIPNFTRYVATFYSRKNIRCNAIVPHGILNNHNERFQKNFANLSPLGRMCDRYELRGPFTFLASDASSYMTGSVLVVDGGWTAW